MSSRRANAPEVRESIEAKTASVDVEMKDTPEDDIDAEGDPDVDMDAEGEEDAEGEVDDEGRPDMYRLIHNLSTYLCSVQDDGEQLAAGFQRIPNRRTLPDYFEIIAEPIAFSTIRGKTQKKQYGSFAEFVKDVAQICHNAQVYNRPSAPIFGAAVRLREILVQELKKLVEKGHINANDAQLPDLGELPPAEESPPADDDEEDEEDDDEEDEEEDDDDDDDDDSDDEGGRRRGRRRRGVGRRDQDKDYEDDSHKRRGRPPSVLTPNEARIASLLKGLRKPKDAAGNLLVHPFEKLPDKAAVPDYYTTILNPIALDNIKKKAKRKKYQSIDHVLQDLNLMFENAKRYNEDDSEVYKAAVELQKEAVFLAEQEKAKPDDDFRDEDGKLPLAEIQHNGQAWKVGDWVHIRNPNDLAKPTVAQIYRTWQDRAGQRWINACWYYRPEQTVHRYEKHFFEHEVVKTGQYRDHQIEEVLDRCFVMFVTRFNKGRPRGFPLDKEIYVCESRYNEERFTFNKIKTWASCVPDEVRDKDYEMDLFDVPRRMKKIPSPIKHLLRDDAKETDELPKPTWGSPNAPPIVGAVHRRKREANESPPPVPTPPPQAMSAVPLPDAGADSGRRASMLSVPGGIPNDHSGRHPSISYPGGPSPSPVPYNAHMTPHFQPVTPGAQPAQVQQTPVPIPHQPHLGAQPQVSVRPVQYQHQPQHSQAGYAQGFAPNYGQPVPPMHQQTPMPNHMAQTYNQVQATPVARSPMPAAPGMPMPGGNVYNPPRPPEVYALPDNINDAMPKELRESFQHDSSGRVLFFTAPPLDRPHKGISHESAGLGHSAKYLAGRKEWLADRERKRKERDEQIGSNSNKKLERDAADARQAKIEIVAQASDAMAKWLEQYNEDTQKWKEKAGLEGWREVKPSNEENSTV
ncbi:chromatin structure-remodeling complex subunit RSC1 [Fusarium pseudoanthophilum]|uniref:Chromatin structure-remodeling complex subunit RSC1 n=1 Tax=Fusarium pseudoanthophilum TaxID=48495 RepID=A0A8H5NUB2_9HYPO|nr:chromatin structure-remodeling complex subunit RSC1 [Fusarium pseudoanthophilum]